MKKLIVLLTAITLLFSCKSNYTRIGDKNANYIPYYLKVYEADSLFIVGNYKKSHKILDSLFKIYEPVNDDVLYEYGTYLMTSVINNDTLDIEKKISFSYKNYGGMLTPTNPYESYLKLQKYYLKRSQHYQNLRKKYLNKIDYKLLSELRLMLELDQKHNRCTNDVDLINKVNISDSINREKLDKIIKTKIYPNYHFLGYPEQELNNFVNISTLLLHQDSQTIEKFLPIIMDAVIKGKCNPIVYAFLHDKYVVMYNNKEIKQKYNEFSDEIKIEKNSIVKTNRRLIGLPSINYLNWKSQ